LPQSPPTLLDQQALRRAFRRAAGTVEQAAFLDREVERRMAERLEYIRLEPKRILDAGAGRGASVPVLRARYPGAEIVASDFAHELLCAARGARTLADRARRLLGGPQTEFACADLARLPFAAGSFGLVWSNLALSFAADAGAALAEWSRVLEVGGLAMFTTYGPDTLKELRAAFAAAAPGMRVQTFTDMHDIGDLLVGAGFADPVMDMEMLTLTYDDVGALVRDLRHSGQQSALAGRPRGLTTPRAWQRMVAAYAARRSEGRLPVTVEVVYGHAWKVAARAASDGRAIIRFDGGIKRRG
jgi:malonyl-CoA O-methyltransferase